MAIEPRATKVLTAEEVQAQIDAAKEGDVVYLAAGRIRGRLVIDRPLTLRGSGADRTVLDGGRKGATISVDAPGEVRIEEMTITGGHGPVGGGLSIDNGAQVHVTGCTFERNSAKSGYGGAIGVDFGAVYVNECTLFDNRAMLGGAIYVGGDGKAEISASILAENVAMRGGAIAVVDGGDVQVWTSRIEENQAENEGHHICTYGSRSRKPRIVLSNALLSAADPVGLPISNNPTFKADIVVDNSTLGRELLAVFLVG